MARRATRKWLPELEAEMALKRIINKQKKSIGGGICMTKNMNTRMMFKIKKNEEGIYFIRKKSMKPYYIK